MKFKPSAFKTQASTALEDKNLMQALANAKDGFIIKRKKAINELPEFQQLKAKAYQIKEHTLEHLEHYLERFEQQVIASGGIVHWASTPREAQKIIVDLCRSEERRVGKECKR